MFCKRNAHSVALRVYKVVHYAFGAMFSTVLSNLWHKIRIYIFIYIPLFKKLTMLSIQSSK